MMSMTTFATGRVMLLAIVATGFRTVWAGTNVWTSHGPGAGSIRALAVDPQNPSTSYAGGVSWWDLQER